MGAVIGIFSAKGGVGKTLLATNLTAAFALGHKVRSALIDLHPGSGTADLLLDLEPARSLADLQSVIEELTPQHLQLAVTPYQPGMDLLACPPHTIWDKSLKSTDLTSLLNAFRKEYKMILLDVPAYISDYTFSILNLVDLRLVILTPDAPALRATSRFLESLPGSSIPTNLVVNQLGPGAAVTPIEIKNYLGKSVVGVLPIDPQGVWANISYGEPCVLQRTSKLGKAIRKLSGKLLNMVKSNS